MDRVQFYRYKCRECKEMRWPDQMTVVNKGSAKGVCKFCNASYQKNRRKALRLANLPKRHRTCLDCNNHYYGYTEPISPYESSELITECTECNSANTQPYMQ